MHESVRFVTYGVVTAAAVGIFACSGVSAFLDTHLLLENTNPGYYEQFADAASIVVPEDVADNGQINLIVNNLVTREYDQGFAITVYEDGSLTYSGTNESENVAYITITGNGWDLLDGSYILTDAAGGLGVAPVSEVGIKLYLQARNYLVGGETQYITLADMTDLSTIITSTDHTQYTDYFVGLAIAPGYSSTGITFYPMLTSYDNQQTSYYPCLLANRKAVNNANAVVDQEKSTAVEDAVEQAESVQGIEAAVAEHAIETASYDQYVMNKSDYLTLSAEDLMLVDRRIQYQHSGRWSTIAFDDGTGIYYPNNDPSLAEYGELNAIGQMELLYGGVDQIMLIERPLNEITAFDDYLERLNDPDYTILVTIRDDGVSALTDELMALLQELGIQTPLTETVTVYSNNTTGTASITSTSSTTSTVRRYYRNSYYAVLNPGSDAVEAAGEDELGYAGTTRDGKASFEIHSAGYLTEASDGSILVNGEECSMNRRGMNIVVYDNAAGGIVDQVTFDTCTGLKAYRELR